jgi:7-carboxy-7-deazaguanine synthase
MTSAYISEIYASVQGEGPYTGEPQVFVRLAGCPLRCDYCDTPASLTAKGHPLKTVARVRDEILKMARKNKIQTVSFTGGEPLSQVGFLKSLFPLLKKDGLRIYLETAGVHHRALFEVLRWVDVISMDIKLPSAVKKVFWAEHQKFLSLGAKKIFVKIVVEDKTNNSEWERALSLIKAVRPQPLLVIQPATARGTAKPPKAPRLGELYQSACRKIRHVLVMPQQHKLWGVR